MVPTAQDIRYQIDQLQAHRDRLAIRLRQQAIRGATWEANLRVLNVEQIKTVPYVPLSHPFIERLIGTLRRECLDQLLFWTATDLR